MSRFFGAGLLALVMLFVLTVTADAETRQCSAPDTSTFFGIDPVKPVIVNGAAYSCLNARRFTRAFAATCGNRRRATGDCSGSYTAPRGRAACRERIVGDPGSGGYALERCTITKQSGDMVRLRFYGAFGI
jgi:hypothetical protein